VKKSDFDLVARAILEEVGAHMKKLLGKRDARLAALEAQLAKAREATDSLERRASRHGQHLAKLETRMQAMERKA
jgi:chromosome segregation ATPase